MWGGAGQTLRLTVTPGGRGLTNEHRIGARHEQAFRVVNRFVMNIGLQILCKPENYT